MSETIFIFTIAYIVAVVSAFIFKKYTHRIAAKAIKEERLSTGIYRLFPVEGKRAVDLANGYIRGANIYFWFVVVIFPIMFVLFMMHDAI